jgi:Fe-S cluster biogenesis protein NfuA/nitrite reductase/ring-hydroxylating ferredoxin subunit
LINDGQCVACFIITSIRLRWKRLIEALDNSSLHGSHRQCELLSLENDVAKLRLQGHCKTCPSSTVTMELALRSAIEEACPDLMGFEVEGMEQLPSLAPIHSPNGAPAWTEIREAQWLAEGEMISIHPERVSLVVCKHNDQWYAYRDHCPACNMPLHLGGFDHGILSCNLNHRYDVQRAGASIERTSLHLEPLPCWPRTES